MRTGSALLVIAAMLATASPARATNPFDDPYALPDAPRPPTLPELTHKDLEGTLELTLGTLVPDRSRVGENVGNARAFVQRFNLDAPIGARRFYVGATYEFAVGEPPGGGGTKVVGGNLELTARAVWAIRTGLAFGGGLGVVLPTSSFDEGSPAAKVAVAAAELRAWDPAFFQHNVTLRPFIDVRDVDGDFAVQFRQGLDYAPYASYPAHLTLAALTAVYVGYRVARLVGIGLEGVEYYVIDGAVPDTQRVQFVVSPSVELMTRYVQPSICVFANLGSPLAPQLDGTWGLRLSFTVLWDPRTQRFD